MFGAALQLAAHTSPHCWSLCFHLERTKTSLSGPLNQPGRWWLCGRCWLLRPSTSLPIRWGTFNRASDPAFSVSLQRFKLEVVTLTPGLPGGWRGRRLLVGWGTQAGFPFACGFCLSPGTNSPALLFTASSQVPQEEGLGWWRGAAGCGGRALRSLRGSVIYSTEQAQTGMLGSCEEKSLVHNQAVFALLWGRCGGLQETPAGGARKEPLAGSAPPSCSARGPLPGF